MIPVKSTLQRISMDKSKSEKDVLQNNFQGVVHLRLFEKVAKELQRVTFL